MTDFVIIDDEPWIRSCIRNMLPWNRLGFACLGEAENGIEALRLCSKVRPQIALTDIEMPGMHGLAFIEEMKKCAPETEIVIISGYDEFAYAQQACALGVVEYLLKPIEEEELLRVMRSIQARISSARSTQQALEEQREALNRLQGSLLNTSGLLPIPAEATGNPKIDRALAILSATFSDPISLESVAERIFMNPSYFSDLFHQLVGTTFTDHLTNIRIEAAKQALRAPDVRVKDAASLAGFSSSNYFSRVFRKVTGMTPTAWQEHHLTSKELQEECDTGE